MNSTCISSVHGLWNFSVSIRFVLKSPFFKNTIAYGCFFFLFLTWNVWGQQSTLKLTDGTTLGPGDRFEIGTFTSGGSVNARAQALTKSIVGMDDGLRKTYVNINRVLDNPQQAKSLLKIDFEGNQSEVESGQNAPLIQVLLGPGEPTAFELFGRRFYSVLGPKGITNFVQGITEVSTQYVRVQTLDTDKNELRWDMRLSPFSFDSQMLMDILAHNASRERPKDWLDIVNFFSESRRFVEAREMLVKAIHKFPELENQASQLKQFDQLLADQLFEAAQNAQLAGQHRFARMILESIDKTKVALETQLKVDRRLQALAVELKDQSEILQWLHDDISKMPESETKEKFTLIEQEISLNLTADTVTRLSDYRRRRADATLKPEQLASLAVSGWLFGPTIGEDNSAVVASGIQARSLITEYLSSRVRNDQAIESISRLEAGSPRLVAKILENMPPPLQVPDQASVQKLVYGPDSQETPTEVTVPGRFAIEVPQKGRRMGTNVRYIVQLPPEYNPYRRYPCVLTIPSQYSTAEQQIDWWVGYFSPNSPEQRCLGEASRRGYIVVSPDWSEENQPSYNYTENEQAAILSSMRDAMRRFSIDVDRVFVSGHFMGATAAWDLALAHPDLWAGCICIGANAGKYIVQYWENAVYVPSYFVAGDLDGSVPVNAPIWDNYLDRKQIDCLISIYQGRGFDHFQEELPKIMDWMSLPTKVRTVVPKEIKTITSRAGDRFFWWFETEQLNSEKLVHPLLYQPGIEYKIESSINTATNSIRMQTVPAKKYTIYLGPEFIDFTRTIEIDRKRIEPKPDIRVMLEDVRGRADRQHPFWMRVDMPQ